MNAPTESIVPCLAPAVGCDHPPPAHGKRSAGLAPGGPHAALVVLSGSDRGRAFPLDSPKSFGRGTHADVSLASPLVSRNHCRIWSARGRHWLRDLRSTNGTWLNGERICAAQLKLGDVVTIGDTSMAYLPRASDGTSRAPEGRRIPDWKTSDGCGTAAEFRLLLESALLSASFDREQVAILLIAIDARAADPARPVARDVVSAMTAKLWSTVRATDRIFRIDDHTLAAVLVAQSAARGRECARRCREALATFEPNASRAWKVSVALLEWGDHADEIAFLRTAMSNLDAARSWRSDCGLGGRHG